MKKMFFKPARLIAAVISAALVLSAVPFAVQADNSTVTFQTGQAVVTGTSVKITVTANPQSNLYLLDLGVQLSTGNGGQYAPVSNIINPGANVKVAVAPLNNTATLSFDNLTPYTTYYYTSFADCNIASTQQAVPQVFDTSRVYSFTTGYSVTGSQYVTTPTVVTTGNASAQAASSYTITSDMRQIDCGFVYSQTNPTPTIGGAQCTKLPSSTSINNSLLASSFGAAMQNINTNQVYYVAAYIHVQYYGNNQDNYLYSSTYVYNGSNQNFSTGAPMVTTTSAALNGSYINAVGGVTSEGTYPVTRFGFAYSYTNPQPTIDTDSVISGTGTPQSFSAGIGVGSYSNAYYVRAYATNVIGTSYGQTVTVYASSANANIPTVTTTGATISGGYISATGAVLSQGASSVTQYGFVYSTYNQTPMLNTDGQILGTGGMSSFNASLNVGNNAGTFYVRAFAVNAAGVGYGQVQTINPSSSSTGSGTPVIITASVGNIQASSADVSFTVTSTGSSNIIDCGVLYSPSNKNPQMYASGVSYQPYGSSGQTVGTGTYTVTLNSLSPDTLYYVCAYARNSSGVATGSVMQVMAQSSMSVTSSSVTNVTPNSASVSAAYTANNNYIISDMGVVYSTSFNTPTLSDTVVSAQTRNAGAFTTQLSNLIPGATYYARAYIRSDSGAPGGVAYGAPLTFVAGGTANNGSPYITVTYMNSADSTVVSTQQVNAAGYSTLNAQNLSVPYGYQLYDPNWTFNVASGSAATVWVTAGAQGPVEQPYMEGVGSYFSPDRKITRGEVAQMIYELRVNGGFTAPTKPSFTDISPTRGATNYTPNYTAIEYVLSAGYMHGYPDGRFIPARNITRAEFAVVLNNVFSLKQAGNVSNFSDLTSDYNWARQAVNNAVATVINGSPIINGYPGNFFRPAAFTTRAEACKMFAIADGRSMQPLGSQNFADVPPTYWAYNYIMNAAVAQ